MEELIKDLFRKNKFLYIVFRSLFITVLIIIMASKKDSLNGLLLIILIAFVVYILGKVFGWW